jgi:hypothetical protein
MFVKITSIFPGTKPVFIQKLPCAVKSEDRWDGCYRLDELRGIAGGTWSTAVTLGAERWLPMPCFADCPILISIASTRLRFSSVTLYLFGTYSKMYLYEFSSDSSTSPLTGTHSRSHSRASFCKSDLDLTLECTKGHVGYVYRRFYD